MGSDDRSDGPGGSTPFAGFGLEYIELQRIKEGFAGGPSALGPQD